jgi:superfamily II DNA/RNA helicase
MEFRIQSIDILITTDLCHRGLDIKGLDHVRINIYFIGYLRTYLMKTHNEHVIHYSRACGSLICHFKVVNFDLPRQIETYIHRVGRTGRIRPGRATSFFDPSRNHDRDLAPKLVEVWFFLQPFYLTWSNLATWKSRAKCSAVLEKRFTFLTSFSNCGWKRIWPIMTFITIQLQ